MALDVNAWRGAVATSVTRWPGWKLSIDGSAPLVRYNHAFLAFRVPGRHTVVLAYLPDTFVIGSVISARRWWSRSGCSCVARCRVAGMTTPSCCPLRGDRRGGHLTARWLRRTVHVRYVLALWTLPIVLASPAFTGKTILPTDHVNLVPPGQPTPLAVQRQPDDIATTSRRGPRRMCGRKDTPVAAAVERIDEARGNPQSAAFSPLTFLMFALPLAHAFTFAAMVKLFSPSTACGCG
jgi:hypothetical protein